MATTKRESTLGKEKRGTSPKLSITHGQRKPSPVSTEKQVPNYLKPTMSSRTDAIKNLKKPGPEDTSQRPNLLRRRSFDRPPSAARVHKALISPGREKPTASRPVSFSSKSTTAPKATLERDVKKPNAGKRQTLSSSRSMKKTHSPTTKRGSTSSASKKPQGSHDKKEAQNLETKHENKENLNHQVEEVLKDDQGEIDANEIPKAEESEHPDVVDTNEVKSIEEGQDTTDISSTVLSQEQNVPQTEEVEDKFHEGKSDHTQHDEDKENHSEEEIDVGHDHQVRFLMRRPKQKLKMKEKEGEGEDYATDEVAATKEIGEEKQLESRQEDDEESQQGLESSKEEMVEELEAEAANVVAKSQVQARNGRKESATPYNDVIEETASKLLEERKNKVRALVGAFETVIDKETTNAK
ncbi:LOW QUALITY PROTEIN: microtubule-associated protein RP/EB family member 1 [Durio zibethinus]|uniref:LOW QUALITY PROTEIN: microtubule-associated protein RP/EB family member 1 n=1 Tax=Durio zibethinus TaxID=66656 RepID=A0A6P5XRG3_DURZI|nr:LOW QUALITY PROTEIN: microtubule-associated protein RP/EB family member 1 [Durio zibethinus]